jgi:membrane protein required for colicin V production
MYATDVAAVLPAAIPARSYACWRLAICFWRRCVMTLVASRSQPHQARGLGWPIARWAPCWFARGMAIVIVVALLAGFTTLPRQQAWRHAMSSAPLEALANMIKVWLPYDLSKHINYE